MKTTTEEQRERWRQGCQAVFAGFVASAHHRGVSHPFPFTLSLSVRGHPRPRLTAQLPASIDIFWLTEQRETITPSLRDLQAEDPGTDAETEARLKGALYKLLLEMNVGRDPHQDHAADGTDMDKAKGKG